MKYTYEAPEPVFDGVVTYNGKKTIVASKILDEHSGRCLLAAVVGSYYNVIETKMAESQLY